MARRRATAPGPPRCDSGFGRPRNLRAEVPSPLRSARRASRVLPDRYPGTTVPSSSRCCAATRAPAARSSRPRSARGPRAASTCSAIVIISAARSASGSLDQAARRSRPQGGPLLDRERVHRDVARPGADRPVEGLLPRRERLPGNAAHQVDRHVDADRHRRRQRGLPPAPHRGRDPSMRARHRRRTARRCSCGSPPRPPAPRRSRRRSESGFASTVTSAPARSGSCATRERTRVAQSRRRTASASPAHVQRVHDAREGRLGPAPDSRSQPRGHRERPARSSAPATEAKSQYEHFERQNGTWTYTCGGRRGPASEVVRVMQRSHASRRYSSTFRMAMKASCGTSTVPTCFIRFLPSFCFSSSLRLRVMSPP